MTDDTYYDEFLGVNSADDKLENLPAWANSKNSSQKAYEAIEKLKKSKKKYIRGHHLKSQYVKKSNYLIQKSEVARLVGAKPQPLFNSCAYSESLSRYFMEVNEQLEGAKERRIKSKGGLRQKKKDELVKDLQLLQKKEKDLLVETVDAIYEKTLNKLSLPVRRKLGLL